MVVFRFVHPIIQPTVSLLSDGRGKTLISTKANVAVSAALARMAGMV